MYAIWIVVCRGKLLFWSMFDRLSLNRIFDRTLRCSDKSYCRDQTDQKDCHIHICNDNEFKCSQSKKCIPKAWVNDGEFDCGKCRFD